MLDFGKGRDKEALFLVEAANLFHVVFGKLEVSLQTRSKKLGVPQSRARSVRQLLNYTEINELVKAGFFCRFKFAFVKGLVYKTFPNDFDKGFL